MKKILFITGTRADYGKIKSLIKSIDNDYNYEAYVYVSGMHLLKQYGSTYNEILKDDYKNVHIAYGLVKSTSMSYLLGDLICNLTGYVEHINPDMIVVHGDRIDAFAGAIVGALNNIRVGHVEGGEVSGTIDESIRHSISKLAHIHFVSNEEARRRLIQLGEYEKHIYVIGSPDIDIMISDELPKFNDVLKNYEIDFNNYGIFMYHPVTTEFDDLKQNISEVVDAILESNRNYIVIYPNNDYGTETILNEFKRFKNNSHIRVFPSIRFECFLTLLKNAKFMIGNSSAGIRETCIYGVPSIDIGTRQLGRYSIANSKNIIHVKECKEEVLNAINCCESRRIECSLFGDGDSTEKFMKIISSPSIWDFEIQKKFIDIL